MPVVFQTPSARRCRNLWLVPDDLDSSSLAASGNRPVSTIRLLPDLGSALILDCAVDGDPKGLRQFPGGSSLPTAVSHCRAQTDKVGAALAGCKICPYASAEIDQRAIRLVPP